VSTFRCILNRPLASILVSTFVNAILGFLLEGLRLSSWLWMGWSSPLGNGSTIRVLLASAPYTSGRRNLSCASIGRVWCCGCGAVVMWGWLAGCPLFSFAWQLAFYSRNLLKDRVVFVFLGALPYGDLLVLLVYVLFLRFLLSFFLDPLHFWCGVVVVFLWCTYTFGVKFPGFHIYILYILPFKKRVSRKLVFSFKDFTVVTLLDAMLTLKAVGILFFFCLKASCFLLTLKLIFLVV